MFPTARVLAAVVAAALATSSLSCGQPSGTRQITVREKVRAVTFVHSTGSSRGERLATGDRVITTQALSDERGKRVGTLYADCANVGPPAEVFQAMLSCTATYRLADGDVVSEGVVRLGAGQAARAPIVGGTRAYRTARGEVTAGKPVKGYDSVDVLRVAQ